MFFDEVGFENQSLDLIVDNDEFEVRNIFDQPTRFRILMAARLKILPDAVAEIFRLADVYDLAVRIFVQVDARSGWQDLKFFGDRHYIDFTAIAAKTNKYSRT